jgi:thiol-disulfide isomerase/thioredoxin/cytochrome c553
MSDSDNAINSPQQNRSRGIVQVLVCMGILVVAVQTGRWLKSAPRAVQSPAASTRLATGDSGHVSIAESDRQSVSETGLPTYITYCAKCHGADGHGDPESLVRLTPPPRDFAGSNWRFAKTCSEIERVIRDGIPGTAMPAMGHLFSKDQLQALSRHVLELSESSPLTTMRKPLTEVLSSEPPERWQRLVDAGFQVFPEAAAAFDMQLLAADRSRIPLSKFRGKAVLLNFWGTSCVHCLKEMPAIAELQQAFSERGLVIISVCADEEDPAEAAAVAAEFAPQLPIFVDATGLGLHQAAVTSLPAFLLLDADHHIVARRSGVLDWADQDVRTAVSGILPEP